IICDVSGTSIVFENNLVHSDYSTAGQLQLITVPTYDFAVVTAELSGQAWDGTTGGVLAFFVKSSLTLDAPINMDGKGFRGGAFENAISNCNFLSQVDDYFYNTPNDGGGKKGESIAPYIVGREYGRGAQAAGGGGGNDHNRGGGGGANAGAGGLGGEDISTSFFNCDGEYPGVGGKIPSLTADRIFLGSGGGAGDGNNNVGTSGGNGGGIILILTSTLTVGAAASISASGEDVPITTGGDGAGGGGAGGSIVLQANSVIGTPILSVSGGKGGDVDNENANRCFGPGGGGGGGLIRTNASLTPTSLVVLGGLAGESLNTSASGCTGATGSAAGGTGTIASLAVPMGTAIADACLSLPVSWQSIELDQLAKSNRLNWVVSDQVDNDFFSVERSVDGIAFTILGRVSATTAEEYTFTDDAPLSGQSFYRVRQTDFDGNFSYSPVVSSTRAEESLKLFPNLARAGQRVRVQIPDNLLQIPSTLRLIDMTGRELQRREWANLSATLHLETTGLPAGLYLVQFSNSQAKWTARMTVTQ
ncbi:MAG: T9SS type A sorting domain-containing protein, partial [Bacteroidota bacterium]